MGLATWRAGVDEVVVGHREEHREYLRERGILPSRPVALPLGLPTGFAFPLVFSRDCRRETFGEAEGEATDDASE